MPGIYLPQRIFYIVSLKKHQPNWQHCYTDIIVRDDSALNQRIPQFCFLSILCAHRLYYIMKWNGFNLLKPCSWWWCVVRLHLVLLGGGHCHWYSIFIIKLTTTLLLFIVTVILVRAMHTGLGATFFNNSFHICDIFRF